MPTYMTTVHDSNKFGGPFSHRWEVQQWIDKHGYDPVEWDFTDRTKESKYFDAEATKEQIDNDEIDVPCGERVFDEEHTETYTYLCENGGFEIDVVAECTNCGFKHDDQAIVVPRL